jgi:SAM-dependent methyltransferase
MTSDSVKAIYQRKLAKPVELDSKDGQLQFLLKWIPQDKSTSILDAGCGNGKYSIHLASLGYRNLEAVDLFDEWKVPGAHYQPARIEQLPFSDHSFDFVFSNSVIFYVDPPAKALKEFSRVLKPSGRLMFTTINRWSPFAIERFLRRDLLKNSRSEHLNGISFFSASYYARQLKRTGFKILHRDGWKFSYFVYPRYRSLALRAKRWFGIDLPQPKNLISSSNWIGYLKSELSYHAIFIAEKQSK